jgi:hypothetical protein
MKMEIIRIGSRKCKGENCSRKTQCYKRVDVDEQLCRDCFPFDIPENRGKHSNRKNQTKALLKHRNTDTTKARAELKDIRMKDKGFTRKIKVKSKTTRIRKKLAELTKDMISVDSIPIGHRLALTRIQCKKCKANANPANITHISIKIPERGPRMVLCGSCGVVE